MVNFLAKNQFKDKLVKKAEDILMAEKKQIQKTSGFDKHDHASMNDTAMRLEALLTNM